MRNWFVCYCAPRSTLRLVEALKEEGAGVFCPRQEVHRRVPRRNRVEVFVKPLFGGLFFCQEESWPLDLGVVAGIETSRIRRMTLGGKPVVVKQEELDRLGEVARESPAVLDRIEPGDWVVVKAGPLEGVKLKAMRVTRGSVHTELNKTRLILSTSLLEKIRGY